MSTIFCPSHGCGAAVEYTAIKPIKCPKCDKSFSAAFNVTPVAKIAKAKKVIIKEEETIVESKFMSPVGEEPIDEVSELGAEDDLNEEQDEVDEEEVRIYAEELKASIDPGGIIISVADGPTTFSKWVVPRK